jgi:methionyl-tRNA formyltransferase
VINSKDKESLNEPFLTNPNSSFSSFTQMTQNTQIFSELKQDESRATFTTMLSKEDAILDLQLLTAEQIFNHFRAYLVFPGSAFFDDYFGQKVKLVDCNLVSSESLELIKSQKSSSIGKYWNIVQTKQQIVLLKCAGNSYLQVKKIKLENGKTIDLTGYQFKAN